MNFESYADSKERDLKLKRERRELVGTLYRDFVTKDKNQSIYKSIRLTRVKDGVAYYECEPYDDTYNTSPSQFNETLNKLHRAFKRYRKKIFDKYKVSQISVTIYGEYSAVAGIEVVGDEITDWNF